MYAHAWHYLFNILKTISIRIGSWIKLIIYLIEIRKIFTSSFVRFTWLDNLFNKKQQLYHFSQSLSTFLRYSVVLYSIIFKSYYQFEF